MFHFGSRQGSPAYGVILDSGSGSIGAAIVESNPDRTLPTLIYGTQTSLRISTEAHDVRRVREALLSTALTLSQEGLTALRKHNSHAKITRILVTCGSPWSYTIARSVSYENDEPFKITKSLIHDLAESAEEEIRAHTQEPAPLSQDFTVVEREYWCIQWINALHPWISGLYEGNQISCTIFTVNFPDILITRRFGEVACIWDYIAGACGFNKFIHMIGQDGGTIGCDNFRFAFSRKVGDTGWKSACPARKGREQHINFWQHPSVWHIGVNTKE